MTTHEHDLTVGIDVGGTKIRTALVDDGGGVVDSRRRSTQAQKGAEHVIGDIVEAVRTLVDDAGSRVAAVGVGIAGQVDSAAGVLMASPNLGWEDVDLKTPLADELGLDVSITNDVAAAAYAEWRFGAGRGEDDLVCLFVGTGVGAGVIAGGKVLATARGPAAELGHVPLVFEGRACTCGHRGCLEAYVGGWAIAERARERVQRDRDGGAAILSAAGGAAGDIAAEHVTDAFRGNDPFAADIVQETGRYLAAAAVGIVNTFNPSLIVFGGGVVEALPELTQAVEDTVRANALAPFATPFRVARAALGEDSVVVGAAALARG